MVKCPHCGKEKTPKEPEICGCGRAMQYRDYSGYDGNRCHEWVCPRCEWGNDPHDDAIDCQDSLMGIDVDYVWCTVCGRVNPRVPEEDTPYLEMPSEFYTERE